MTTGQGQNAWTDACLAAALFAIDPAGTGGVALRSGPGPVRDAWLALVRELLDAPAPVRRLPVNVTDDRLLGGLDLPATLKLSRPVVERGLLAEADGGILIVASAERLDAAKTARVTAAIDSGRVRLERDGFTLDAPARFGVVALDEGHGVDEQPRAPLTDRLAFRIGLDGLRARDAVNEDFGPAVSAARQILPHVSIDDAWIEAVCQASAVLGIASVRAALLALKVARAAAAFDGRRQVGEADIKLAAQFVLGPRATQLPAEAEDAPQDVDAAHDDDPPEKPPQSDDGTPDDGNGAETLDNIVLDAATSAIPAGLLEKLRNESAASTRAQSAGKSGAAQTSKLRGRPAGARPGKPGTGARLNVIETLRAAAPWQSLRRHERTLRGAAPGGTRRIEVRPDDFRITRFKERAETATIFVVDASGSSALHRLGEAKGAVELLLADCYVRRDNVALIAFRGRTAELLLPPTRSLTRAKRSLIGLPGGGGTPLAAAVDATLDLVRHLKRKGQTPTVLVLTDGRANIARDGSANREAAEADALGASARLKAEGVTSLLIDTFPHRQPKAERVAAAMGARYLPLPYANSALISDAVRATNSGHRAYLGRRRRRGRNLWPTG